jgi:uncharacterized protein YndB with AHSA1/START domain
MTTTNTDSVERKIVLKAPRSRVWRAIATASEFGAWFKVALEGEFKAGETIAGKMTEPGYEGLAFEVDVEQVIPEMLFSFRWRPYAGIPDYDYSREGPGAKTLVTFALEDVPEGTLLTLTESGFENLPPERRLPAFEGNSEGWDIQVERIRAYVGAGT